MATRGLCSDLFREVLASHDLVICSLLLKELERVLLKKFKVPRNLVQEFLVFLIQGSYFVETLQALDLKLKDLNDKKLLSTAFHAEVQCFVTGDQELVKLKAVKKMKILSPRGFSENLKT